MLGFLSHYGGIATRFRLTVTNTQLNPHFFLSLTFDINIAPKSYFQNVPVSLGRGLILRVCLEIGIKE